MEQLARDWNDMAGLDPEWSILSDPSRSHGRWHAADFFETGRHEIESVLEKARSWGLPTKLGTALDDGCGVGRVSRALAANFESVIGVDISGVMLARAREMNSGMPGLSFDVVDPNGPLSSADGSHDLVYCRLVLQHVPAADAKAQVVAELVRVLAYGGLLVLQVPSYVPIRRRLQLRPRLYALLRKAGVSNRVLYEVLRLHPIRMTSLPEDIVRRIVEGGGGTILETERIRLGTPALEDRIYWATKSR